ncbi:MAG: DUF4214 domain-containing protein [Candidatus Saccharibacteria bacterium]
MKHHHLLMKDRKDSFLKSFDKINFGSGWDYKEGYLNVDVDKAVNPDLLIVNDDYSVIPRDQYVEIYARDVLEHIPRDQTLSVLLDWSNYLKPDGSLYVQTTSILAVAEQLKKHPKFESQYGWQICLYGNQAHPGDFHHTGFTEQLLKVNLLAAGFAIDSFKLRDTWLFHVDCHKVSDWKDTLKKSMGKDDEFFAKRLFKDALGRKPDGLGYTHVITELKRGVSREALAKHIYSSVERLYYTAKQHNL